VRSEKSKGQGVEDGWIRCGRRGVGGEEWEERSGRRVWEERKSDGIMSARREREDESARGEWEEFLGEVQETGSRMKMETGESGKRLRGQYQ